jgi:signal transduction histidine kinase
MSKLTAKLLALTAIVAVLASFSLFYSVRSAAERHVNEIVEHQASMALSFDLAIRHYIAEHVRPVMHNLLGTQAFQLETMSTSYAARSIFDEVRKDFPDYIIKFSSDNPRNPSNQAGAEELAIIDCFNANPDLERWQGIIAIDGKRYLAKFSARRMEQSCLLCHGDPKDAPASLLEQYGATAGFHRPPGQVIGLDMVAIPVGRISEIIKSASIASFAVGSLGLCCFFLALGLITKILVINRLTTIAKHFKKAAIQDDYALSEPIEVQGNDEISDLATSFNLLSDKLRRYYAALDDTVRERTKELNEKNSELEQEIAERRQAETEKRDLEQRLARSQKMEALGLLAGGVAHDLNNVLSGIVSYPDLILMDLDPDSPLAGPIRTIKDSGIKAAAIVQDLLTLARRGVANTELLNLNTIVGEYFNSPEHDKLRAYHPNLDVRIRCEPDLPSIRGSSVHLKKTVMNLVSNAAEAMPGGGTILVSTSNEHLERSIKGYNKVQEGDYCVLRIQDSGVGIDAMDLNRIFEPFYTKKVMGRSGTGLGMSVVWGTVQDHHGYINVESTMGQGTLFELFFPVTRESPDQNQDTFRLDDCMGNGESILVVDDLEAQREIASEILKKLGYAVETAASGEQAMARVGQRPFDLIVLDMIMDPGIDGLETYRRIRAVRPDQKALIASGFSDTWRIKAAQELGAGRHLKKPYTIESLAVAVMAELRR